MVQLQELFDVRHSVFIVGNAGTGKSMVWKSLFKANQIMKKKPMAVDLNPKAVTNNELFGIINPATREWKDGLQISLSLLSMCDIVDRQYLKNSQTVRHKGNQIRQYIKRNDVSNGRRAKHIIRYMQHVVS